LQLPPGPDHRPPRGRADPLRPAQRARGQHRPARRPALARAPGRRARAAHPGLLKMTVTVAHALPADLDALAALFDAYRQFYGLWAVPGAAVDGLRQRLRYGDSRALLARLVGQEGGFSQLYPVFATVRLARVWILTDLFVLPAMRR